MKKSLVLGMLAVGILLGNITAQAAVAWEEDFERALAKAEKSGKYLLLNFSGSDWCGPCKALERGVFSQKEFKEFAQENLICVEIDFPQRKFQSKELKAQNKKLASKYGLRAYPTVIILSPGGKVIEKKIGYDGRGATNYIRHLKEIIRDYEAKQASQ